MLQVDGMEEMACMWDHDVGVVGMVFQQPMAWIRELVNPKSKC